MIRFSRSKPRGRNRKWTEPISTRRAKALLMEFAIRAFSRETPGRTRNRASSTNTATITTRRLEEERLTALLSAFAPSASRQRNATPRAPGNQDGLRNRFCDIDRLEFQTTNK